MLEEDYNVDENISESMKEEAERLAPVTEHVAPAVEWLQQQPEKKYVVQIQNVPQRASEE